MVATSIVLPPIMLYQNFTIDCQSSKQKPLCNFFHLQTYTLLQRVLVYLSEIGYDNCGFMTSKKFELVINLNAYILKMVI